MEITESNQFILHIYLFKLLKKCYDKKSLNYCTFALISHASKVVLKIFQARLQHCMNQELPDIQAGFRKGRGTRDQTAWRVQFQNGIVQGPDRGDGWYFRNFQNIQSDVLFFHSFICLES